MFLFLLSSFAISWSDELLVIAAEIMFRATGDSIKQLVTDTLLLNGETLDHLSLIGAWISYVERAPFNTDSFNHWRFKQTPINKKNLTITEHSNIDDLKATGTSFLKGITNGEINGEWPYNFAFKSLVGLMFEAFSPIHTAEFFDDNFKNGDDSGRNFFIRYNGKNISLLEFWDTGCMKYTRLSPFSQEDWTSIRSEVDELYQKYPKSNFHDTRRNFDEIINESYELAVSQIYKIKPNTDLNEQSEYTQNCIKLTQERIAHAGATAAAHFSSLKVPIMKKLPPPKPFSSHEPMAWIIFCIALPLFAYSAYKYFTRSSFYSKFD